MPIISSLQDLVIYKTVYLNGRKIIGAKQKGKLDIYFRITQDAKLSFFRLMEAHAVEDEQAGNINEAAIHSKENIIIEEMRSSQRDMKQALAAFLSTIF